MAAEGRRRLSRQFQLDGGDGEALHAGVVLANPTGPLPLSGKPATKNEIAYARWADKTPHIVISKTLNQVTWKATRIVRDLEEIRRLKRQQGRDIHVVGGATLVGKPDLQRTRSVENA